ncbi:kelch-like protein 20 [Eurytemora carolleeae]|uniref:kelch-like protein 20 n=1 Tax=Eurytemora carolleeae TaxID=1294199 RepID=UPI000C77026D|nr:kelch-like protein 20 [Eurytemora carolleeae]|eukprot:XP_023348566.1 kelch-like protein 20 [Eurytemora affinis]
MGCALYKDEIFAVGGIGGSNGNDVEIYNIQRKEWRTVGKLAGLKRYGPMHVFNGKLTIFGGGSSTIEAFKEDDETWETVDTVAGFNSDYGYGSASVPIYCKV